jgi:hypothetical protein
MRVRTRRRAAIAVVGVLAALGMAVSTTTAAQAVSGGATGVWYCGRDKNRGSTGSAQGVDHPNLTMTGPFYWCASYQTFLAGTNNLLFASAIAGNSMVLRNNAPDSALTPIYVFKITYSNRYGTTSSAVPTDSVIVLVRGGQQLTVHMTTDGRIDHVSTPAGDDPWSTSGSDNELGDKFFAGIYTGYTPRLTFWFINKEGFRFSLTNYLL